MAEVLENTEKTPAEGTTPAAPAAAEQGTAAASPSSFGGTQSGGPQKPKKSPAARKKQRRRIIRAVVLLAILGAGGYFGYQKFFNKKADDSDTVALTDSVQYGAITAKVEGNGLTRAKNSETINLTTSGVVQDLMVEEGDHVTAGTPLFVIDSEAARTAVQNGRKDVEGYEKQLRTLNKDILGLNLTAPYPGKLMDIVKLNPGDDIAKGTVVATLADDTRLRLTQYYSYAYEGQIWEGKQVQVSIPTLMSSIPGTVEAVHMVSRITPEGSRLYSADILVENQGALTAGMSASATAAGEGGETIYPYEPGKLEYFRTGPLTTTVGGKVISSALVNYLQVSTGQLLLQIDGEDSETEIFTVEQRLAEARKNLEAAEKNLANCNAVAPIDGTVIGLTMQLGDEIPANTTLLTISDTENIVVNATVDERNISYIQKGMTVDLDQWGTTATGIVESVSLSSTVANGVASYPMVVSIDNAEGNIQVNSNIRYSLIASQNDNCLVVPIQCVRSVSTEDGESLSVVYVQGERPDNAVDNVIAAEEIPEDFWAVPVEIGIQDSYNVEIRSGLEEGQTVFTQLQRSSSDGMGMIW